MIDFKSIRGYAKIQEKQTQCANYEVINIGHSINENNNYIFHLGKINIRYNNQYTKMTNGTTKYLSTKTNNIGLFT